MAKKRGAIPARDSLEVAWWPIERAVEYDRNPRTISEKAVGKVAASIKEFGWRQPLVVDEKGILIVGHTRLRAAKKLGLAKVPVHVASGWTEAQKRAYRIADNRTGEETEWDEDRLRLELAELGSLDLSLLGFDQDELDSLRSMQEAMADDENVPAPPKTPVSRPGDLWVLGEHRVLCGDATSAEQVGRLQGRRLPFIMVTDPPYGVEYDPEWRHRAGVNKNEKRRGKVANDERVDWSAAYKLFPGRVAYVWHAGLQMGEVKEHLRACEFEVRAHIVWSKPRLVLGRGHYHWQHETCWYAVRPGASAKWRGDRSQTTVWTIAQKDGGEEETIHGTQKPLECMARPIRHHGGEADEVYDPFLGSGTTLIAAERLGRRCLGLDIDPSYVDVIVRRWANVSGGTPTLEGDGKTGLPSGTPFADVAAARGVTIED